MTKEEAIEVLSESIHDGSKVPWDKIVEAVHLSIEALSQPSLPSDLNDAAKKYAQNEYPDEPSIGQFGTGDYEQHVDMGYPREIAKDAFKAGAEWMAGQGETLDSLIWRDEDDKLFIEAFVDEDQFKMADIVTIQIRKKQ